MMAVFYVPIFLLPLILAVILSGMMRKHRICEYEAGSVKVPFGSLTRRALAQIIDLFVMGTPAIVGFLFMIPFDFEEAIVSKRIVLIVGLILGELLWGLVCLLAFSFLEGKWGLTPGKWIFGIRVIGTDLKPCGFWRGLIRNLLTFADGFFNFMVGILLAALTDNWQRLGDLAANTIVVEAKKKMTLDLS